MSTTDPQTPGTASPLLPDLGPSPFGLRKILVPTDFSEESYGALRRALDLARQSGGEILFVHVVEPIHPFPANGVSRHPGDLPADPVFESEGNAEKLLTQLGTEATRLSGVPIRTSIRIGRAYDQIVHAAQEYHADLIVISTHGYTGLRHVLLGSTAERVVRHASCAVLVLRCDRGQTS